MPSWWEQDWVSLGEIPKEPTNVSGDLQAVMNAWGAAEGKARKLADNGAIGSRIAAYIADSNSLDLGEVALLQQDLDDFREAADLFLDDTYLAVKWTAGTELPGFVSGFLKATPLDTVVSGLGGTLGDEAEAICKDAIANWKGGGYQKSMVYEFESNDIRTVKVSFSVEDDLAKATANGFSVPAKIVGIDITFNKDGLFARNQRQMQAYLKKTGDKIDYYCGGGKVMVIEPDDANDSAWLAIQRDSDAQKGRIKVGDAHLYASDDKAVEAVKALIDGLAGFTADDGYKLGDGTDGVKEG